MILSATCLPLFVWWELRIKNPIINVRLFKEGIVTNGVGLMVSLGFFLYAVVFILPVFLGTAFHYTATQIGVFFIPGSLQLIISQQKVVKKDMTKLVAICGSVRH